MAISIPDGYETQSLPESKSIQTRDKGASLKFQLAEEIGQISISFNLSFNSTYFPAEEYKALQELFRSVVDIQKNSIVVLTSK